MTAAAIAEGLSEAGPWSLAYIEDAATFRRVIMWRGRVIDSSASNYDPPDNGVHLCGQTDDGEQPTTVAIYRTHRDDARAMFEAAKAVAECAAGEEDFIVDLCVDRGVEEDFYSNRQLWPRAIEAWNLAVRACLGGVE